jgi:transcriptional regulator with XRE-family HTH domain
MAREVCGMPDSFGARLRQRREERRIALATIAEQTKIKLSLLEALERDDVRHWPAGIFGRAFIRAYSHAIGLQPDVVVRDFLQHHPEPVEEVATESGAETAGDAAPVSGSPPTRLRHLVGAAVSSLSRLRPRAAGSRIPHVVDPSPAKSALPNTPVTSEPPANTTIPSEAAADAPPPSEPDLSAAAWLCTELARVDEACDVAPLLRELARLVDAVGLIVWVWDSPTTELTPALAHGYSDEVLAQLPKVKRDARNATAAAFRSAQTCIVKGRDTASDALVVPLMTPTGCAGVLAIEMRHGAARKESVRALATIFAAQMARLVGLVRPDAASDRRLA